MSVLFLVLQLETHNKSAIMFHKSAHGQLSCWFKLWAFSFFIFFFFPQVSRSYFSNLGILSKMHVEPKQDTMCWHGEMSYGNKTIYHLPLDKLPVHSDCDGTILRSELHHKSRMSSQLQHYKVVIALWLRNGNFFMVLPWHCVEFATRGHS